MSKDYIFHGNGIVIKKNTGLYHVQIDGRIEVCTLASRLLKELIFSADNSNSGRRSMKDIRTLEHVDLVAVGDRVLLGNGPNGTYTIVEVLPRSNRLARRSAVPMPTAHPFQQVIAANIDQVVPVFAATMPPPKWNMLDRYLASAESLALPALICITKLDLTDRQDHAIGGDLEKEIAEYRKIGYPVILTSAKTSAGLVELKVALQNRISVLMGKSGVGKTTLLNALQPGLGLRVNEVNQSTGKGKHTTSTIEMILLDGGGAIIDTPGVREFGLWDLDTDDLALFFPEMRPLVGKCRFGLDCHHDEEPGCASRKAVMANQISPRRYQSYLHLQKEGYFYD